MVHVLDGEMRLPTFAGLKDLRLSDRKKKNNALVILRSLDHSLQPNLHPIPTKSHTERCFFQVSNGTLHSEEQMNFSLNTFI